MKKRLKYITNFIKPYIAKFCSVFFIIIITTIIVAFYPYIYGKMIDILFYDKNVAKFFTVVLVYLVIYLLNQILHYCLDLLVAVLGIEYSYDIKKSLIYKVLTYKSSELANINTGDIISRVNSDADEPLNFIYHDIFYGISAIIDFFMCLGIVAIINSKLAIIMFVMSICTFGISKYFERKIFPLYYSLARDKASNTNWLFEFLGGMRDLKLICAVNRCYEKYMYKEKKLMELNSAIAKKEIVSDRANDFVKLISNIVIFSLAAFYISQKTMTLGGLAACVDYYNRMMLMMDRIYARVFRVSKRMVAIDRIIEIDERPAEFNEENIQNYESNSGVIEFKNVKFAYSGNINILKDLNLSINVGERIAIVGKSGEGKTTIAQLLCRLYEVDDGCIYINGENIKNIDVKDIRKKIGIVSQDTAIFENTVRYNLIFSNDNSRDEEIWNVLKKVELDKVISSLPQKLDTYLNGGEISMSGGQYQRLAIARGYLKKAEVLIFDESTSAIDGKTEESIIKSWDDLFNGKTIIVIAHRYKTIRHCERIAVLENGRILACDTHEHLIDSCRTYRELFENQARYKLVEM